MITTLKKYASFSGRASRSEYWAIKMLMGVIFIILLALNLGGLSARALGNHIGSSSVPFGSITSVTHVSISYSQFLETGGQVSPFFSIILFVFMIARIILDLAVSVRRIHDLNKSSWWLLWLLLAFAGIATLSIIGGWLWLLVVLAPLWVIFAVWVGFFPGTKGENRFGSDPLQSIDAQSINPSHSQ